MSPAQSVSDPLAALLERELGSIDPTSELAHHGLRHCRDALSALERGERHLVRSHLMDAWTVREGGVADVGGRPMTEEERSELTKLRAQLAERAD
jgi:hypothetical protein